MKYVLIALLASAMSVHAAPSSGHPGADLRAAALRAEAAYAVLGPAAPTAEVISMSCGEENAFYYTPLDTVFVCSELTAETTDAVTMVVAHELGHAVLHENDLSQYRAEDAADELATLVLLNVGDRDAVVAGAEFIMRVYGGGGKNDPHSTGLVRARQMLCADDGLDGDNAADPGCTVYLHSAVASWTRILAPVIEAKTRETDDAK